MATAEFLLCVDPERRAVAVAMLESLDFLELRVKMNVLECKRFALLSLDTKDGNLPKPIGPEAPASTAAKIKKPEVSVFLGYPLYDDVHAAARTETLDEEPNMGWFVKQVFLFGWKIYRQVGSLHELRSLSGGEWAERMKREVRNYLAEVEHVTSKQERKRKRKTA